MGSAEANVVAVMTEEAAGATSSLLVAGLRAGRRYQDDAAIISRPDRPVRPKGSRTPRQRAAFVDDEHRTFCGQPPWAGERVVGRVSVGVRTPRAEEMWLAWRYGRRGAWSRPTRSLVRRGMDLGPVDVTRDVDRRVDGATNGGAMAGPRRLKRCGC